MNQPVIPKGWDLIHPISADWSPRKFYRVAGHGTVGILMQSPATDVPGHKISDFIRIEKWLRAAGVRVPGIAEVDGKAGWAIVEDFGDLSLKRALDEMNYTPRAFYMVASDILHKINEAGLTIDLPAYEGSYVHKGKQRLIDWYVPASFGEKNHPSLRDEYLAAWQAIENSLPPAPRSVLHMDYHAENIMLLDEEGTDMLGLIDFQGAMIGPAPYDLANLLEDARRDIGREERKFILDYHCDKMPSEEAENFHAWYRVLATQFHCRVIGQAIKLAVTTGNTRLLEYIPGLQKYLIDGIQDPVLDPLKKFIFKNNINFSRPLITDLEKIRSLVASDAF